MPLGLARATEGIKSGCENGLYPKSRLPLVVVDALPPLDEEPLLAKASLGPSKKGTGTRHWPRVSAPRLARPNLTRFRLLMDSDMVSNPFDVTLHRMIAEYPPSETFHFSRCTLIPARARCRHLPLRAGGSVSGCSDSEAADSKFGRRTIDPGNPQFVDLHVYTSSTIV